MDWQQSRFGYYFDFVVAPVLALLAVALGIHHGGTYGLAASVAAGVGVWTFLEYWIHRVLFHRTFRRAHWLHHKRPGGYDAVPPWLTGCLHVLTCGGLASTLPLTIAAGMFAGLELGYLAYIMVHDQIHHRRFKPAGWFLTRWRLHMMHHQGIEKNFGVFTSLWDRVFGTHFAPEWRQVDPATLSQNLKSRGY